MKTANSCGGRPPLRDFLKDPSWALAVVAHRGAWHGASENSLESVEAAIANAYEFVEIDVQATDDGELVCFHDTSLERMTGQPGTVARTSAADLTRLYLKARNGGADAAYTTSRVPRFADLLDRSGDKIYVDVDVKHMRDLPKVGAFVSTHPACAHLNLKVAVASAEDLAYLDGLEKETGVLVKPVFRVGADTLGMYLGLLQARPMQVVEALFEDWQSFALYAKTARQCATDLFLNTLDDVPSAVVTDTQCLEDPEAGWGRLLDHGVRLIQTDAPAALKAYARP